MFMAAVLSGMVTFGGSRVYVNITKRNALQRVNRKHLEAALFDLFLAMRGNSHRGIAGGASRS